MRDPQFVREECMGPTERCSALERHLNVEANHGRGYQDFCKRVEDFIEKNGTDEILHEAECYSPFQIALGYLLWQHELLQADHGKYEQLKADHKKMMVVFNLARKVLSRSVLVPDSAGADTLTIPADDYWHYYEALEELIHGSANTSEEGDEAKTERWLKRLREIEKSFKEIDKEMAGHDEATLKRWEDGTLPELPHPKDPTQRRLNRLHNATSNIASAFRVHLGQFKAEASP